MRKLLFLALGLGGATAAVAAESPVPPGIHNVVVVPGAFVDGSGWRGVYDILTRKGYHVSVVQTRAENLADDVSQTDEIIRRQDGPVVLVGHSYGGAVITQAGNRDQVKALVYVSAVVPDVGESLAKLVGSMPAAGDADDIQATGDGHLYFNRAKFAKDFAADVPKGLTDFMANSQAPAAKVAFDAGAPVAAWHDKPSWAVVSRKDRALNPDLERWMYKRAGSKVTEIESSHVVYISQPAKVAAVIEDAATKAR